MLYDIDCLDAFWFPLHAEKRAHKTGHVVTDRQTFGLFLTIIEFSPGILPKPVGILLSGLGRAGPLGPLGQCNPYEGVHGIGWMHHKNTNVPSISKKMGCTVILSTFHSKTNYFNPLIA